MSNSGVIGSNNIPSCPSAENSNVVIPGAVPGAESHPGHQTQQPDRMMPVGLQALYSACMKVYPEQPNPLQVTTRLKYWLGGHDPLDYISMYWNPGRPDENIPPHWHYVSFGLSDLHGDGRVHPEPGPGAEGSGYGIELTFRLAAEPREPPLWPAALLQSLARYVFTTGNKFCAGDHISWHSPLDGSKSRIRHLLVATDPQLGTVPTPHGSVSFVQIVGCTNRELKATQRGSGFDVLKTIAEDPGCGGAWLVTELRRGSARRVRTAPTAPAARPADLAGVTANVYWRRYVPSAEDEERLSPSVERQIKETLQRGLSVMSDRGAEGHNMSTDSFEMSSLERALPPPPPLHDAMDMSTSGSWRAGGGGCGGGDVQYLDGVHLILDAEAASLLPLAIDGRVLHSRHFTWRRAGGGGGGGGGVGEGGAVTLVPPAVAGAFVTPDRPYAARDGWLQVLIPEDLARDMSAQARELARLAGADSESEDEAPPPPALPLTLRWPRRRLQLTVRPADL